MLIEIPPELKDLGCAFAAMLAAVNSSIGLGQLKCGESVNYGAVEKALADATAKIECAGHRAILQSLDVDAQAVVVDGASYRRVGRESASYYTLAGPVVVERSLYRKIGVRNDKVVDAVSLRAGVVGEGWLPQTARAMAHELQKGTSREAETSAREVGRLPYSRSSFERVGHAVGELYVPTHAVVEAALIDAYEVPEAARTVSASLDRVSVPMEEPRKRPRGRPRKGAPKRPVARHYRMAYVGALTLHDEKGEALHTIRYGRMPKGDADGLAKRMGADIASLLLARPDLKVELLCDGAPEMWNLLEAYISPASVGTDVVYKLIDFCHVIEKLNKAIDVIHVQEDVSRTRNRWKLRLLNYSDGAKHILEELHGSGHEHTHVGDSRPVHDAITYLENNAARYDYCTARKLGLPIGSGNVEATCKSLFNQRFKRAGSRWKEATGEHVVQLRALALSDRWGKALDLTLAPLRKTVVELAAA
jgi:hypothetical protein